MLRHLAATQSADGSARQWRGDRAGYSTNRARARPPNYYGVDTTPLFVMLAGTVYARTADLDLMSELWPAINAALRWIDVYGDTDGDGFVETPAAWLPRRGNMAGRVHRTRYSMPTGAWRQGPLALCEVQGYVYAGEAGGCTNCAFAG